MRDGSEASNARGGLPRSPPQYFDDVKMQTEAKKWADEFNKKKVPKKVDFIAAYIVELTDRWGPTSKPFPPERAAASLAVPPADGCTS